MRDFMFIVLFFLLATTFLFLLRLAKERLFNISLINGIFISLLLFSFIGTLPLYFGLDEYNNSIGVKDKSLVFMVMIFSSAAIIFFLLGVIFYRHFALSEGFPVKFNSDFLPAGKAQLWLSFFFILASFLSLMLYLSKVPVVALFTVLQDGAQAGELARSKMGNDFDGRYHWYRLFFFSLSMFISYALWASYIIRKNKLALCLFFIAFSICSFSAIMSIEKAPIVYYFLGLFFVWVIIRKDSHVNFYGALKLVVFILTFMSLVAVYFVGADSFAKGFGAIISRAFASSISPAYLYLEIFPDVVNFQYGKTISNPGGIFPYEPFNYTVFVMNYAMPELARRNVVGSAPTVFWGEVFVNFNWYLIPIFSFMIGVMVALLNSVVLRLNANAITVGFMVWLILFFKDLAISGFSGFIFSVDLFVVSLAFIGLLAMRRRRKMHSPY